MKARSNFKQAGHAAIQFYPSSSRFSYTAQYFEQGTFPSTVATNNAHTVALLNLKI